MVYRDGQSGRLYAKKFKVGGVTRDKEYPLFKTHSKSRIFYFSVHDSEKKNSRILVHIDPELKRVREKLIEFDFSWLDLQGRAAKGSTLTSHKVDRVVNAPKAESVEPEVGKESEKQAKSLDSPLEPTKSSDSAKETSKPAKVLGIADKKSQDTFDFNDN
jgi:topoisomerase-4 subunit A